VITSLESPGVAERFRRSALTETNPFQTTEEATQWLADQGRDNELAVDCLAFEELGQWSFEPGTGDLVHRSGKFFRVRGLQVEITDRTTRRWAQPIIDQPEIGILGIVAKEFEGRLLFLMQAKLEPGNPDGVQLTPTVQATRSNYTQVHQGARPKYLDYFLDRSMATPLVDQLQFEQGSTFLRKRNRNIVVETKEDVPVEEGFRWFTLGQIKRLLGTPNLVSMDARTVVSCIPFCEGGLVPIESGNANGNKSHRDGFGARLMKSMADGPCTHGDEAVQSWLTELKCRYMMTVHRTGLSSLEGWRHRDNRIAHDGDRFFNVLGVRVKARNREVYEWDQPLVQPAEKGLVAFLVREIDGVLHFLVQGKVEPGNPDTVAVGPTVHFVLGQESLADSSTWPLFTDVALKAPVEDIRFSCVQAEEGGRFYHAENEYRVVEVDSGIGDAVPDGYLWITLRQLTEMLRYGLVNVEARSLLSCLSLA